MIAIEFKDPNSTLTRGNKHNATLPANLNKHVQDACMERGLLTLTTSIYPVLRMIPALIVTGEEVDEMLATLTEAIAEVARGIQNSS